MNNIVWKQYDSRWGSKAYPSGSTMSGCGCGCVACTHIAMEQPRYAKWTPENLRPWMVKQGFAVRGKGTTWDGITKTLQHLGYKVVHIGINDPMSEAWKELNKGNRIGIILFKSGRAPNGIVWTAGGHYVAFTDYYVKNGKHYFYTKDSGGRGHDSKTHGYYTYENSMKGTVYQMWIVERLSAAPVTPTPTPKKKTTPTISKVTVDGVGGPTTVKAAQKVFGTTIDGVISGQSKAARKYYPAFSSMCIEYGTKGSSLVKKMQKKVKVKADGILGQDTVKAWQKFLGLKADGIWGKSTMKAFQKWLNGQLNPSTKTTKSTKTSTSTKTTTSTKTSTPTAHTISATDTSKSETIIDVSYVQKSIDWNKVKAAGVKGAIIRCGYRGYGLGALNEDALFMSHITGANKAGLKLGIYFFTEAINAAEGKAEAQFALKMLKKAGVKLTYPIAIDTENINAKNPVPRANSSKLSATKRTEAIKAFCEEIRANGYEPMIYASTDWLNNQLIMSKLPYKVWVAQYNTKVTYKGNYVIWQYSSVGKINGISGVVDMNHSYINVGTTTAPAPSTVTKVPTSTSNKSAAIKLAPNSVYKKMTAWAVKIANQKYHYVRWKGNVSATHTCPICKGRKYDNYYGWNCIGFAWGCWHHGGGLKSTCNCGVISNEVADKILQTSDANALKMAQERIGLKDIKVIRNNGKAIPISKLQEGDIILFFRGKKYYHTAYYMGNGKYAESNTTGGIGSAKNIRAGLKLSPIAKANLKLAFRYTGK